MSDHVSSRWLMVVRTAALVLGVTAPMVVACDSDDGDDASVGDPADCRLIANRCHRYDDESELARECHEVGHDGTSPKKCTEMRPRCEAECPPVDPDAGTGGSSGGAGAGSGGTGTGASGGGGGAAGEGGAGGSAGATTGGGGEATGGSAGASAAGQGGTSNGGTAGSGTAGGGTTNGGTAGGGMSNGGTAGGGVETACETLGRICHDAGPGRAEECHELGHDGNEPACEADFAECLAVCTGT